MKITMTGIADGNRHWLNGNPRSQRKRHMRNNLLIALLPIVAWGQASTVNYSTMYVGGVDPTGLQSSIATWLSTRINPVLLTYGTNLPTGLASHFYAYTEGTCLVPNDATIPASGGSGMYALRDAIVVPNGYNLESMFLHHSVDFKYPANNWNGITEFDAYDINSSNGLKINGVLNYNGSTYADVTVASYTGGATTVTNTLYVGSVMPFDQANFTITTGQTGGTVAYNYWNGSAWTAIPSLTDGTSSMSTSGQVYWPPPSNWAITAVNGSKTKYWFQIVIGGSPSVNVKYSKVLGDDWSVSSAGTNTRGWDASNADGHHINIGTPLEYDPTPPSNATAHFPAQARMPCPSYNLYAMHNDSYIVSSVRAWSTWLNYKAKNSPCVASSQCGGIMFDDFALLAPPTGGTSLAVTSPTGNLLTYYDDNQSSTLLAERQAQLTQTVANMHTALGPGFKVGGNNNSGSILSLLDFSYVESSRYNTWEENTGPGSTETSNVYGYPDPQGFGYATFDNFLTANNSTNSQGYMLLYGLPVSGLNPGSVSAIYQPSWHEWDKGNREPIAALAFYFIGKNSNTGFAYYNLGNFFSSYSQSDTVLVYAAPTTLAASIGPVAAGSNTIQLTSAAGCSSSNANVVLSGKSYQGGETIAGGTVSGNNFTTTNAIYNAHTVGDVAYCITSERQSQLGTPVAVNNVWAWGPWFPARAVNIGIPNTGGLNGGVRITPWKTGGSPDFISGLPSATCTSNGHCPNVFRRDYTGAIVLWRGYQFTQPEAEWDTPSQPLALGGTYYPLLADNTTGPGVTSITLRSGEGAIMMNSPIGPPPPGGGLFPLPMPVGSSGGSTALHLSTLTNAQLAALTNAQLTALVN